MPNIFDKLTDNTASSFSLDNGKQYNKRSDQTVAVYDINNSGGGTGGGGNQILAQGRLYNTTYAIRSGAINFHQIGFNGPPVWGALGASLEYIEWNFPGINTLDYIIKVVYGGYGYRGASGAEEWLILGDNIRLQWDADSGFGGVSFEYNQMDHYISVEASPF